MLCSMVQSVKEFVAERSAMAILNVTSFMTAQGISSLISSVDEPAQSTTSPSDSGGVAPLVGIHLSMSSTAFIAVQLLQHAPSRRIPYYDQRSNLLQEIVPHRSLMTLYLSGANAHVLLSESHKSAPPNNQVSSVHVAVKGKCAVLQLNLSALVPVEHGCSTLPGLVVAQQQLDFSLLPPSSHSEQLCFALHDLLEVGLKELTVSVAASIITSSVQSTAVVSWDQVVRDGCTETDCGDDCGSTEEMNNVLGVKFSVGSLWSQIAAPQCGLAQPSSGGLDLLIVMEAIQVWQDRLPRLVSCVQELVQAKAHRDKHVLLTLVSIAARTQSLGKPFNPVLHKVAAAYRKSVWFSCMQHLCSSLCFFSEVSVPSTAEQQDVDVLLVAAMLALASKLYSLQGTEASQDLVLSQRLTTPTTAPADHLSISNTGYVSVSPSPSDMAVPNRRYGADMEDDVDMPRIFSTLSLTTLRLLRESLVSFFSAAGVSLKQQLRETLPFKNQLKLDFSLEMREATLFVLEYLAPPSDSAYLHTQSTAATPALFLEQLLLQGNMEHNAELTANKISTQYNSLLPNREHTQPAKVGVVSNCCASLVDVRVVVNAPLLKVTKHISGTGKFRRKLQKQAKMCAADSLSTPRPAASTTPSGQQTDFTLPTPTTAGHVTRFATSAVREILSFEKHPVLVSHAQSSGGSSPTSHIRLLTYPSSPKPPVMLQEPQDHTLPVPSYTSVLESSTGMAPSSSHQSHDSSTELTSDDDALYQRRHNEVSVTLDDGTSPEEVRSTIDTWGEDTTDSLHMLSSDNDEFQSRTLSDRRLSAGKPPDTTRLDPSDSQQHSSRDQGLTGGRGVTGGRGLYLPRDDLLFSVFALLKCHQVTCEVQIETTRASLVLSGISASMDTRNSTSIGPGCGQQAADPAFPQLSLLSELLPTYVSVSATLKNSLLRVNDRGLPESDVLHLELLPMYVSIGINNCRPLLPCYRCLLKLTSLNVEIKQSAVKVHKRFQQLMPSFTNIYNEIFGKEVAAMNEAEFNATPTSGQGFSLENVMKLPSKMPVGLIHLSLDKTTMFVAPLPSLGLTYNVSCHWCWMCSCVMTACVLGAAGSSEYEGRDWSGGELPAGSGGTPASLHSQRTVQE